MFNYKNSQNIMMPLSRHIQRIEIVNTIKYKSLNATQMIQSVIPEFPNGTYYAFELYTVHVQYYSCICEFSGRCAA